MKIKLVDKVGFVGTEQRNDWSDADKRAFKAIPAHAAGRGWSALQYLCLLDVSPETVEVELIADYDKDYAWVALKECTEERAATWTQRPYVRKSDGKSAPNVSLRDDVRQVQQMYAVDAPKGLTDRACDELYNAYYKDIMSKEQFMMCKVVVPKKYLIAD